MMPLCSDHKTFRELIDNWLSVPSL